jgi:hypothetical protein
VVEAAIKINDKIVDVAKSSRLEFREMKNNIAEATLKALKTGKVTLFGTLDSSTGVDPTLCEEEDDDDIFATVKRLMGIAPSSAELAVPY